MKPQIYQNSKMFICMDIHSFLLSLCEKMQIDVFALDTCLYDCMLNNISSHVPAFLSAMIWKCNFMAVLMWV